MNFKSSCFFKKSLIEAKIKKIQNVSIRKKKMKICFSLFTNSILKQNRLSALIRSFNFNVSLSTKMSLSSAKEEKIVKRGDYIIWADLEMSGLNIDKDHILEMACLITDKHLNIVAEGPDLVIKQADEVLEGMDEWCQKTHTESGLVASVKSSSIELAKAEDMMLEFVQQYCPAGKCPLAGNSIHMDRLFLNKYMKRFTAHLHHRIIDVSTIKELGFRWFPNEIKARPMKKGNHRALDDIKESVEELKFYRKTIFKNFN